MGQNAEKSQKTRYTLIVPNAVQKDLRRLPPQLQEELLFQHFPSIQADPHKAPFLKGKFRKMRKYALSSGGTEYRVVYRVVEKGKAVVLIMVGSREGFYERLEQRIT
ncbi:MAG: type II toxin-antitoxin system RelE family toxin [Candidatus Bipolaricaulia bacterium]